MAYFKRVKKAIKGNQFSLFGRFMLGVALLGPGLMVMLADTDAGSVITAAQSGAEWGYRMILPQLILIPMLFLIQEMTVRLGVVTKKGHGELIRERFGFGWAALSVATLFLSSVGALVTEFSGIAGVGALFGLPAWFTVSLSTVLLIIIGLTGSYLRVERIGIAVGLFELFFIPAAIIARPDWHAVGAGLITVPLNHPQYLYMLAANVGAVIMPWMIFYQQGAVIEKGLTVKNLKHSRWDTLGGSILTQVIMIAVVVTTAATVGRFHSSHPLDTIQQIATGLVPFLGTFGANLVFGMGMLGASFIASIVVSLAGSWGIGEAFGFKHSLNDKVKDAKLFYFIYTMTHVLGAILVIVSINLVRLSIDVEVMNAMLLPIVIGLLLALEAKALPTEWRMKGLYKYTVWGVSLLVIGFGLFMTISLFI